MVSLTLRILLESFVLVVGKGIPLQKPNCLDSTVSKYDTLC